jgi:site-specific DNA-methyltransferase (adenine-specific)
MEIDNIYNMDCLEGMKQIPDGTIDAVICDLPYGTTKNPWDSVIPLDELWREYRRIIKPAGAIVLFAQQPFAAALIMSNPDMFKYEWIWEKDNGTGFLNANYAPLKIHENILVFSLSVACFVKDAADAMRYNPQMRQGFKPYKCKQGRMSTCYDHEHSKETITVNDGNRYPIDIIQYNKDRDTFHPTQKPVDLLRYLVLTYTNEGDTVLDNCMGSGTTAIACIKEKRHFIGFELNKEYYEKAVRRIRNEQRQLKLF